LPSSGTDPEVKGQRGIASLQMVYNWMRSCQLSTKKAQNKLEGNFEEIKERLIKYCASQDELLIGRKGWIIRIPPSIHTWSQISNEYVI
jgi:hypothetical protein